MSFVDIRDVRNERIHIDPDLMPKPDDTYIHLFGEAMEGRVPVYFATVPLALCVPFDLDYRPDLHRIGGQAIEAAIEDGKNQKFYYMVVYPHGKWFVVADDYIPLFAALRGRPDYVPCWILGKPDNDQLKDVQGPIAVADLRKIFGLDNSESAP